MVFNQSVMYIINKYIKIKWYIYIYIYILYNMYLYMYVCMYMDTQIDKCIDI